jgi:3-oxoadipate enol-lactonase
VTVPELGPIYLAWRDIGSGAPILLIHGLGGSSRSWSGVVRQLRDHYRVLSFDLPGHGESPAPGEALTLDEIAASAAAHLAAAGVSRPIVVGHSVGGFVALLMARLVEPGALVLVGSGAGPETMSWLRDLPRYRSVVDRDGMAGLFDVLAHDDPAMRDLLGRKPELILPFRASFASMPPTGFLAVAAATLGRRDLSSSLEEIAIPTAAVVGSLDADFLPAGRDIAARTGGRLVILEGLGHMPMLEDPEAVAAIIDEVAASIPQPERAEA